MSSPLAMMKEACEEHKEFINSKEGQSFIKSLLIDVSDKKEEEEDMQPYYEVYVENTELDIDDYFGPYDSYEQCVEFINENYTEENINDKDYTFEIQEQEPNGEGSYYAYPDRAIKPGD